MDFNGVYEYSNVIAVKQSAGVEVEIFPNPTLGKVNLNFVSKEAGNYTIIVNDLCKMIHKESTFIEKGNKIIKLDYFNNLSQEIYFIQILNENNEIIKTQKISKS